MARQWLFDWDKKSELVKMLDADDILIPSTIEIMTSYYKDSIDGIFCPLTRVSHYQFVDTTTGSPKLGHSGSGSMMLSKKFIEKVTDDGFKWTNVHDHDNLFFKFCEDKSYNFVTTIENFLYIYFMGMKE